MSAINNRKNRYRQVREDLGWSRAELAGKMGVDATTLGNWETGARQMTLEKLMLMSEVTGFSVQYLLGYDEAPVDWTKPIAKEQLAVMHRSPVWTASYGWGLVNIAEKKLVFADLASLPFDAIQDPLYAFPPTLAYTLYGTGEPLLRSEVASRETIWLEVITTDIELSTAYRGWYHVLGQRIARNEFGDCFYLDNYGTKWLAFEDCF